MRTTRRRFMAFAGAAVASPALLREGYAQAPQVTLKMHHFLPPVSNGHAKFLAPWAQQGRGRLAGGGIKIDIFPSMQLGGTPPQLYDQARDGVADIVWTLPGSTPGRFPGIEVFELPFVAARRGVVNAKAIAGIRRDASAAEAGVPRGPADLPLGARPRARARQQAGQDDGRHEGPQAALPDAAGRRGAEGARRRPPSRCRSRRCRNRSPSACIDGCVVPVGGGAGDQGARAGEVPHRDPGLADALHRDLHPRHEQAEVREPAGRPQGGDRQELGPGRRRGWPGACGTSRR